ncbi:hypothetical protein IPV08_17620 [Methylobacterium sp. SD274]|uniref:hypothetical protein n=1 Tax=Methylobacterium sp. SD274 TaxID=2782009 RepID=UPI001A95EF8B|nr:hypothetical protein [Methylobacterium sp. SD274]MBO1021780.1 hypothetical protein [Methylobacterium sp. SD274]
MAETIPLRVAKAAIKRDARASNRATARLLLDPESAKRLAALADRQSGKLATLAIDGREIERQRVSSAFATGELSLTGIPLSKIGSTVVLLMQGSAHLTIRIDSDKNER